MLKSIVVFFESSLVIWIRGGGLRRVGWWWGGWQRHCWGTALTALWVSLCASSICETLDEVGVKGWGAFGTCDHGGAVRGSNGEGNQRMNWEGGVVVELKVSYVREEVRSGKHVVSPCGLTGVGGNAGELIWLPTPYVGIGPNVD